MAFAANFTAIDFETANRNRDSACQLAAVVVRDGTIVDQAMWMIRPTPLYFSPGNIRIHGITPDQVAGERAFGDLWPEIQAKLADDCIVAHNASFDIGVLRACLTTHRCATPELQYTCTRAIARRTWAHRPRFGLKPLAEWLGISFRHHDALEDSIACAKILLAAGIDQRAESLEDLETKLRLSRGTAGEWGQSGPAGRRRSRAGSKSSASKSSASTSSASGTSRSMGYRPDRVAQTAAAYRTATGSEASSRSTPPQVLATDWQRLMVRAEFIRPLCGKRVVFAGSFEAFDQGDVGQLATRLGGESGDEIDASVDVLVMGKVGVEESNLRDQVDRVNGSGGKIEVVDEDGFLGWLIADRATHR